MKVIKESDSIKKSLKEDWGDLFEDEMDEEETLIEIGRAILNDYTHGLTNNGHSWSLDTDGDVGGDIELDEIADAITGGYTNGLTSGGTSWSLDIDSYFGESYVGEQPMKRNNTSKLKEEIENLEMTDNTVVISQPLGAAEKDSEVFDKRFEEATKTPEDAPLFGAKKQPVPDEIEEPKITLDESLFEGINNNSLPDYNPSEFADTKKINNEYIITRWFKGDGKLYVRNLLSNEIVAGGVNTVDEARKLIDESLKEGYLECDDYDIVDKLGYSAAVEFGDGVNSGKIFADSTTLRQLRDEIIDNFGIDCPIINESLEEGLSEHPHDLRYRDMRQAYRQYHNCVRNLVSSYTDEGREVYKALLNLESAVNHWAQQADIDNSQLVESLEEASSDRKIEDARKTKEKLAKKYGVPVTSIVWKGGKNFIIVKDGKEISVDADDALNEASTLPRGGKDEEFDTDAWSVIYWELSSEDEGTSQSKKMKRRAKVNAPIKSRYSHVDPVNDFDLRVYASDESGFDLAKKIADAWGVEYKIEPTNNIHANKFPDEKLQMTILIPEEMVG